MGIDIEAFDGDGDADADVDGDDDILVVEGVDGVELTSYLKEKELF